MDPRVPASLPCRHGPRLRWTCTVKRWLFLLDRSQDRVRGHAVGEQHAVEVVVLMLEAARQQPLRLDGLDLAAAVLAAHCRSGGPLHGATVARKAEAAFLGHLRLLGEALDLRVDEHVDLLIELGHEEAFQDADLRSGEPDPLGRAHGLDHVVNQALHGLVNAADWTRLLPQDRISETVDVTDWHG